MGLHSSEDSTYATLTLEASQICTHLPWFESRLGKLRYFGHVKRMIFSTVYDIWPYMALTTGKDLKEARENEGSTA